MTGTDSNRAVGAALKLGYHAGLTDAEGSRTAGLLELVSDGQDHLVACCEDERHPECWRIIAIETSGSAPSAAPRAPISSRLTSSGGRARQGPPLRRRVGVDTQDAA